MRSKLSGGRNRPLNYHSLPFASWHHSTKKDFSTALSEASTTDLWNFIGEQGYVVRQMTLTNKLDPLGYWHPEFGQTLRHRPSHRRRNADVLREVAVSVVDDEPQLSREVFRLRWDSFKQRLLTEVLDPGYDMPSESQFRRLLDNHYDQMAQVLGDVIGPPQLVARIVYMTSHFDFAYVSAKPALLQFVTDALSSSRPFVQRVAVGAFEEWRGSVARDALSGFCSSAEWLNDYVQRVLVELEQESLG